MRQLVITGPVLGRPPHATAIEANDTFNVVLFISNWAKWREYDSRKNEGRVEEFHPADAFSSDIEVISVEVWERVVPCLGSY